MKFITLHGADDKLVFVNPEYIAVMTEEEDQYDDGSKVQWTSLRLSDGTTFVNVVEPPDEILTKIIIANF